MSSFEIIVGSMLGATEYVADALAETLLKYDLNSRIHLTPDLSELDPQATWLVCTSTHAPVIFLTISSLLPVNYPRSA